MASRSGRANRGRWQARTIRVALGGDIRDARLSAGVSQRVASVAADMSHAQYGRIERGELPNVSVDQLSRACAAVGLRLAARAYPDGPPVRDAAHLALLGRFRERLPAGARWQVEAPLPISGDGRAWDALATIEGRQFAIEAETRLYDLQALQRRIALKCRDGGVDVVVLLVNDTATNRRILRAEREGLRPMFPLDGRTLLAALRSGTGPTASAIILL